MDQTDHVPTAAGKKRGLKFSGAFITVLAFVYGFYLTNSFRDSRRTALMEEGKSIAAESAAIRDKLHSIYTRQTESFEAYVVRCVDLEPVIDRALAIYERQHDHRLRMAQEYKGADTQQAFQFLERIDEKDRQGLEMMKREITLGKKLTLIPASEQMAYYREKIQPLQAEEARLAQEEVAIAKEAQAKGVRLPDYVVSSLK